jgi:hypothetical protein
MKNNEHAQAIPAEVLQAAQQKLNETFELLRPYALTLTPSERQGLLVMGDKTLSFVEKAIEFARQNPALIPSFLNMEDFAIDMNDATGLRTLLNTAKQIVQSIDDTAMVAGSEAFQAALIFYNSVKYAATQDVAGAKAVYEDLHKRFSGGRRKSSATDSES